MRTLFIKLLTGSLLLLHGHVALNAQTLPEFAASYSIYYLGIKGAEAQYQLKHTDSGYDFTQNTKLTGIASLFASDTVSIYSLVDEKDDQLLLTKHSYIQTGREKNKDESFDIDWHTTGGQLKGTVSGIARGNKVQLQVKTPVWDVLSFQLPLMIEANAEQKKYPYKALLNGEVDTYNFDLVSIKNTQFADREYQTLQLVRKDPKRDRQLHIWVIPQLHNIPVLVEHYWDGKLRSRMSIDSVSFNGGKSLKKTETEDDDEY